MTTADLRIDAELLWDGSGSTLQLASVAIAGEEIVYVGLQAAAPEAVETRSVAFLLPGFRDEHVHIRLSDPRRILASGVTRVRDLAWPLEEIAALAGRSASPSFAGPAIEFCGPMLTAPGGYPTDRAWAPPGTGLEVSGADDARRAAERILDAGAVALKVALNAEAPPVLGDRELAAICEVANRRGSRVIAHAQGRGQVERALDAGVDELAHTPWTEPLATAVVGELARRCRIVSTLEMHRACGDLEALEVAVANLAAFHAAGGRIAYGTDLGNGPQATGISVAELWHLARVGLSDEELLRISVGGWLAPGLRADVVGLAGDPGRALRHAAQVTLIVRGGRVFEPAPPPPRP